MAVAAPPLAQHHPLSQRIVVVADTWARSHRQLVTLAGELADSGEWILAGSPTAAHHIAALADIEPSTAREWIRVAKRVRELPIIAARFADGTLSYAKVRALVALATPQNEAELAELARDTPAGELRRVLARWLHETTDSEDLAAYHHQRRSLTWRTDPDGMVTFSLRLPPHLAAILVSLLTTVVMGARRRRDPEKTGADGGASWPTLAQQHADAFEHLLTDRAGRIDTEVVLHVRADGATTDDGTPIPDTIIADIAPRSFIRVLIHDAEGRPVNASTRRRHPTARQKRVVAERDKVCCDCGSAILLEFDHVPDYTVTGRTHTDELELRCAPCHRRRHRRAEPADQQKG